MDHQYIETNGIRLHVLQDGPKDAPTGDFTTWIS